MSIHSNLFKNKEVTVENFKHLIGIEILKILNGLWDDPYRFIHLE